MSHGDVYLNEYGELVDAKEYITKTEDFPKQLERETCYVCGRRVDVIFTVCRACNDDRAYCSDHCFEQHLRSRHYEDEFCAECDSRLPKRYTYSSNLNSKLGKNIRFCDKFCLKKYRDSNVCAECDNELPTVYKYADDIDRAKGKRMKFCSPYCLRKYRKKTLCGECGCDLPDTYKYGQDIDRAMGERVGFCSSYCLDRYRKHNLCAECDCKLPSTYNYCPRCGSNDYRFCSSSSCYDRHCRRYH